MGLDKHYNFSDKKRNKKKYTKQGSNIASEVVISYDPSVITKNKRKTDGKDNRTAEEIRLDKENERRLQQQATMGSRMSGMGLESSMGKDQRIYQLRTMITNKEVITLQSAMQALALSKGTIITYLKEMGMQMYDAEDGKFVGSKDGKKVGMDI